MPAEDVYPLVKYSACITSVFNDQIARTIWDVKFYPYSTNDDDQIFALVADELVQVCRTNLGSDPPYEILQSVVDEIIYAKNQKASYNSVAWTKDPVSRKPWLCIAGSRPKHINILDVESGKLVRTLLGHGRNINDLAISPLSTSLLVSAGDDVGIRLWNLEPEYESDPCVAIFHGAGHTAPVLAIHLHPNGKWMLSGGIDTAVCLWAIPPAEQLSKHRDSSTNQEPKIVHYPHFFSKEVPSNYVDCFAFYNDVIISRSSSDQKDGKHNQILGLS